MRKALVNDWYYVNAGADRIPQSLINIWDDFEHYALIDFYNDADREFILKGKPVKTSFIQKLPTAKSNHRKFLQLFPYAIEQFDLSDFDLIISSSASVAKNVLTHHEQLHISYCHSPMRYAWDMYHEYLKDAGLTKGLKGLYAKWVMHRIRNWDVACANRVDHYIANSHFVKERIKKVYNREAAVIYPPVDTDYFTLHEDKQDYYYTAGRFISYKKTDLLVEAFANMPDRKFLVAGDGPDLKKVKKLAGPNVTFLGYVTREQNLHYMQNARAFLFAAKEDFGIAPVEAQACGTPVIAYAGGGALETVIEGLTGTFFNEQTTSSIQTAINRFEDSAFDYTAIRKHSEKFSKQRFEREIKEFIDKKWEEFKTMKLR
jgi:glycosyltransferase involved in cell wall biosynthesis